MLYITRHSETKLNAMRAWQGLVDAPLTPIGRSQALNKGRFFANKQLAYVFCSPMQRCKDTLNIILSKLLYKPVVVYDYRLVERSYGLLEGMTTEQGSQDPELEEFIRMHQAREKMWWIKPPFGESYARVESRAYSFIANYLHMLTKQPTLILAHGNILKLMSELLSNAMTGRVEHILPDRGAEIVSAPAHYIDNQTVLEFHKGRGEPTWHNLSL